MNPSYNSGSNIPGVKPGTIASGPEPGANGVPAAPVNPTSAAPANPVAPNPVAPTGNSVRTPMGRLGSARPGAQTAAPVVLPTTSAPKKSNRGIIIAGIFVIIALIVAIVAVVIVGQNGGGNGGGKTVSVSTALKNVNNYLQYGNAEGSTDTNNSNDANNSDNNTNAGESAEAESSTTMENEPAYVQMSVMGTYEEQTNFFNTALEHIKTLKNALGNNEAVLNVTRLENAVAVLQKLSAVTYTGVVWDTYVNNGTEGLENYITSIEEVDVESGSIYDTMLETAENLVTKSEKLYEKFSARNCITENGLDDECIDAIAENDTEASRLQSIIANIRMNVCTYTEAMQSSVNERLIAVNEELGYE